MKKRTYSSSTANSQSDSRKKEEKNVPEKEKTTVLIAR